MSEIITKSFKVNLNILDFFHYYPAKKNATIYIFVSYLIYTIFIIPVPALGVIYLLTEENLDFDRVNYNAGFLFQALCFVAKLWPFVKSGYRIRKCVEVFESVSFKPIRAAHRKLVEESINTCKRNTNFFLYIVIGGVFTWSMKPFFWTGRNLPVDLWLPYNFTENLVLYCATYSFVTTCVLATSLAMGVIDPLIAGLTDQVTTQFKILKDNLEHLSEYVAEEISNNNWNNTTNCINTIMYIHIRRAINHQNTLLRFIKEFENCFSPVMMSQIISSVFILCFCCLQLSKVEKFGYYAFQLTLYFGVILGELYFYFYYGTLLFEESGSIVNAIYMGQWYNFDMKCKKALITIMECSNQPVKIKIGIILEMTLVTFTMILRRSYSLLAVLKNYQ